MTCRRMVVLVLEDSEAEISSGSRIVGNVGALVVQEESGVGEGPMRIVDARFCSSIGLGTR